MQNFTDATIEGYVTHEPRAVKTKTGKEICKFSVAVNHYSEPDTQPWVSYVDVETWEKLAETCSKNVIKGLRVLVNGTLRQDRWEGNDGKIQSRLKIIGHSVRFLGPPKSVNGRSEVAV